MLKRAPSATVALVLLNKINQLMERETKLALSSKRNTIKIMNQLIGSASKPTFYVVTRNGRRAWSRDYWTITEAQDHAQKLIQSLKNFKDPDANKIIIMETEDPSSIN
jgi:hypothetical protein